MTEANPNSKPAPKRRRARKSDGTFQGDNPATEVNEAWEPVQIDATLPKTKDYSIKPKVGGPSQDTAGKYSKNTTKKARPTFGTVTTKFH